MEAAARPQCLQRPKAWPRLTSAVSASDLAADDLGSTGRRTTMQMTGTVEQGFERLGEAFASGQSKDEGGAQLCVYRRGVEIASLATGRDTVRDRPYTEDTLSVLMSCSKGVTTTAAHMLVERGLIDPAAPVTRYWPEFGAAGKSDVRVHHLLTHTSGLMGFAP